MRSSSAEPEGRIALVTGGGRGIGASIARELAGAGMRVAVTGRTKQQVVETAREITDSRSSATSRAVRTLSAVDAAGCAPRLVRALASGRLDRLAGRYLHAEHDDPEELAQRADEIVEQDLNAIRLRPEAHFGVRCDSHSPRSTRSSATSMAIAR